MVLDVVVVWLGCGSESIAFEISQTILGIERKEIAEVTMERTS